MTTIGVKYHDEDIHNIIHKPTSPTIKSPRYKSKRKICYGEERKKYNGHQTFGLAHYEPPESHNFLRKKKFPIPPTVKGKTKKESKSNDGSKTSSLPKYNFEKTKKPHKNFVKENIKKAAQLQPKVPVPRSVVTPRGTVKDLAHLLQMIRIRQSEEYGKVPEYLCKRQKQWTKQREAKEYEEEALREYKEKMSMAGTMEMEENVYMVDEETRQQLLRGLKENWNELSKQFLKLPVMIDTLPKIKRKEWLEREIDQVEKDLRLVESHPFIYLERRGPCAQNKVSTNPERKEEEQDDEMRENLKENEVQEEAQNPEKAEPQQVPEEVIEPAADDKKYEEVKVTNY